MKYIAFLLLVLFSVRFSFAQNPRLVLPIGHTGEIHGSYFTPDSKKVLTISADGTTKLWNAESSKLLATLEHDLGRSIEHFKVEKQEVVIHQRDDRIVRYNPKVTRWNTANGQFEVEMNENYDDTSSFIAEKLPKYDLRVINVDFKSQFYIKVVDAVRDTVMHVLEGYTSEINVALLNPTEDKIVTASVDGTVKLWDARSGKLIYDLKGHSWNVVSARFSADGKRILTASEDKTAKLWDATSGALLVTFRGHAGALNDANFDPDGTKVVTSSDDMTAKVWDARSGMLLADLRGYTSGINVVEYSPAGNRISVSSDDFTLKVWDAGTINLKSVLSGHLQKDEWSSISSKFSPDGKNLLTYASGDSAVKIWNTSDGKLVHRLKAAGGVHKAAFSPDSKTVLAFSYKNLASWDIATGKESDRLSSILFSDSFLGMSYDISPDGTKLAVSSDEYQAPAVWDLKTGTVLKNLGEKPQDLFHVLNVPWGSANIVKYSPKGDKLLTSYGDTTLRVWDTESAKMLYELHGSEFNPFKDAAFSADSEKILTYPDNRVWDATTGKQTGRIRSSSKIERMPVFIDHSKVVLLGEKAAVWDLNKNEKLLDLNSDATVLAAHYTPDGEKIITASTDQTIKLWDNKTGGLLLTFLTVDSTGFLAYTPEGYYQASPAASKLLHYVTEDLNTITFEQLDVKYNRPDKVLEAIGSTDAALIESYRKAYEKRLKKLGIDTTSFRDGFSVPESDFQSRNSIDFEQKKKKLKVRVSGHGGGYFLDRFNIWVNEVPLFGSNGIDLSNRKVKEMDTTLTVTLSSGKNVIETSLTNVNGIESYRIPLYVNYKPKKPVKEKVYFIGIGINRFADSRNNLKWSVKDVRDLAKSLKREYGNALVVDTLFDQNVTASNILALKRKLLKTGYNDKVILSYSGHGLLSKDYDYYLSTYNVDFENPAQKGLAYDELEKLLDGIPARKKLMLIDACHSGEVDKEELSKLASAEKELDRSGVIGGRGVKTLNTSRKLGMKNSFELMQELFVNVSRSTGATVISAAAGTQFALERNELQNGVFTFTILELMKQQKSVTVSELKQHVSRRVPELTSGLQVPTTRNEVKAVDWKVW